MAWICVDAGTSVVKSVAYLDDGREMALARQDLEIISSQPGFAEQDMMAVWNAVVTTVRIVTREVAEPIRGIALTAQGDGCWLVDAEGEPTGNAILWNDGRAKSIVDTWHETGVLQKAFQISGCMAFPGVSSAILKWLEQNDPGRIKRSRWVLSCNGWLFSKLTGHFAADHSDASNPFGDAHTRAYSSDLVKLYQLQDQMHLLPPRYANAEIISPLTAAASPAIGIEEGTSIVMAPYDIVTTSYGCGAVGPGQACVILGTTICAEIMTSAIDLNRSGTGTTIALDYDLYLRAMPTLTGCEALTWATKFLSCDTLQELDTLAGSSPVGANDLLFLPYLSLAGERAPFLEPHARGSYLGLHLSHTRADFARALYEGLAFVIRECVLAATNELPTQVHVCGGGSRSDFLCQTIADVCGIPIIRTDDSEVGARGAFLFAIVATSDDLTLGDAARQYVHSSRVFTPTVQHGAIYLQRYHLFLEQRRLSLPQWHLLKDHA